MIVDTSSIRKISITPRRGGKLNFDSGNLTARQEACASIVPLSPVTPDHEVHDRCGVGQAVGVVIAAGFADDLDFPAERLVAFPDDVDVLTNGNGFVGVSNHGENRDSGFGKRGKGVYRVLVVGNVESFSEQGDVSLRLVAEELGAPDPWLAGGGSFRADEQAARPATVKSLRSKPCQSETLRAVAF